MCSRTRLGWLDARRHGSAARRYAVLTEDVLGALLHLRARDRVPDAAPAVASFADVTYLNLTAVGLTRLNAVSGGLLPNLKALVVAGNLLTRLDDLSQ